jgi:hypothetical protein
MFMINCVLSRGRKLQTLPKQWPFQSLHLLRLRLLQNPLLPPRPQWRLHLLQPLAAQPLYRYQEQAPATARSKVP